MAARLLCTRPAWRAEHMAALQHRCAPAHTNFSNRVRRLARTLAAAALSTLLCVTLTSPDRSPCLQAWQWWQRRRWHVLDELFRLSQGASIPPLAPSTTPPHRSPRACATARRLADLLIRREQAAQDDFFRAEKLLVVQQHSASTRCCCGSGERSRATSWTPPKAAKAAAQLGPRPQ